LLEALHELGLEEVGDLVAMEEDDVGELGLKKY
jgi:hypothetical protein